MWAVDPEPAQIMEFRDFVCLFILQRPLLWLAKCRRELDLRLEMDR